MGTDTVTKVQIYSKRVEQAYEVHYFTEYSIDIDLETDSDQFHMVFANPEGRYTGLFNKFDPIIVYINNEPVLKGTIDDIEYNWDSDESVIQVVGRDMMSIFVDNDALPTTLYNVKPHEYIKSKLSEYGIDKYVLDDAVSVQEKVIIGSNESEIAVMNNLVVEDLRRIWMIYDTVYMGKWNTSAPPSYRFTRGVPADQTGVPIKTLSLKDSGADLRSEVKIYGSTDNGDNKVVGTAKNQSLIDMGVRKRRTMRSSNNDSSTKYASSALEHIRDDFRSGIELKVTIKTRDAVVLPGRTAQVIDYTTRLNSTFFIRGVNYKKDLNGGSMTTVTMVPDDTTFEVLWTVTGTKAGKKVTDKKTYSSIVGLPETTLADLLSNKK